MTNRTFVVLITLGLWTIVVIGVWIIMIMATTKVHAADDRVCKPYASQLLNNNMNFFWQRAFNHCKLLEEDNPIPPASGDWRAALDILEPDHTPIPPVPPPSVATIGVVPATEKPSPAKPAQAAPVKPTAGVAAAPATSAATIAAKCKKTHPAGFQAGGPSGRGTYNTLVGKKWVRVPCS